MISFRDTCQNADNNEYQDESTQNVMSESTLQSEGCEIDSKKDYECKFNPGDWIVNNSHTIWHIICIHNESYFCVSPTGQESYIQASKIDSEFHIWTIDDAVSGDFITIKQSSENIVGIFIFNKFGDKNKTDIRAYILWDIVHVHCECRIDINKSYIFAPANRIESAILLDKLSHTGYFWNYETMSINLIENTPTETHHPKFGIGQWIISDNHIPFMITEIKNNNCYCCKSFITDSYEALCIDMDRDYHIWSKDDIRDGDVLVNRYGVILIYKQDDYCEDDNMNSYCCCTQSSIFTNNQIVCAIEAQPADRTQYLKLMKQLSDGGYKWDVKNLKCIKCATNDTQFNAVYCLASDDGKGVIEALVSYGGNNIHNYDGKFVQDRTSYNIDDWHNIDTLYYINASNVITQLVRNTQESADMWALIMKLFTEVKALKNLHWRACMYGRYYYIEMSSTKVTINHTIEGKEKTDNLRYEIGNYFKTKELAEYASKKILELFNSLKNNSL